LAEIPFDRSKLLMLGSRKMMIVTRYLNFMHAERELPGLVLRRLFTFLLLIGCLIKNSHALVWFSVVILVFIVRL